MIATKYRVCDLQGNPPFWKDLHRDDSVYKNELTQDKNMHFFTVSISLICEKKKIQFSGKSTAMTDGFYLILVKLYPEMGLKDCGVMMECNAGP